MWDVENSFVGERERERERCCVGNVSDMCWLCVAET